MQDETAAVERKAFITISNVRTCCLQLTKLGSRPDAPQLWRVEVLGTSISFIGQQTADGAGIINPCFSPQAAAYIKAQWAPTLVCWAMGSANVPKDSRAGKNAAWQEGPINQVVNNLFKGAKGLAINAAVSLWLGNLSGLAGGDQLAARGYMQESSETFWAEQGEIPIGSLAAEHLLMCANSADELSDPHATTHYSKVGRQAEDVLLQQTLKQALGLLEAANKQQRRPRQGRGKPKDPKQAISLLTLTELCKPGRWNVGLSSLCETLRWLGGTAKMWAAIQPKLLTRWSNPESSGLGMPHVDLRCQRAGDQDTHLPIVWLTIMAWARALQAHGAGIIDSSRRDDLKAFAIQDALAACALAGVRARHESRCTPGNTCIFAISE